MKTILLFILQLIFITTLFAQINADQKKKYYCSPCGCANDGKTFDEAGDCPICKMKLLEVGTFNFQIASVSRNGFIVYSSNKKDNKQQLFLRNLNGPTGEKLISDGSGAQFSPNGDKIVFIRGENSLWIYDIASGKETDLSKKINLPGLQTPAWVSSGNAILFAAGTFPNIGIYHYEFKTEKTEALTNTDGLRYGCAASPDGKNIAYRCVKGTDKDRQRGIAVLNLATKEERYITNIGEYCTWSPDGGKLAFHWPDSTRSFCIYTVNADGSDLKKIAGAAGSGFELPVWSADGATIYFQTNKRRGNWEIWSMKKDGSDQKPVIWE